MTKKEIEKARHLFSLIGYWAKQGEGSGRILEFAREGYYLLGEVQDPFPNERIVEVEDKVSAGIILGWSVVVISLAITAWTWWQAWQTLGKF